MKYRVLGRTGLRVGEIGVGCEGFLGKTPEQVSEWLDVLEEAGANCIDLYTPDPAFRGGLGRALRGRREKFVLQAHLCSVWKDGQYKRSRDIVEVRASFEDQLRRLETDHVEIGMVHYVDSLADWEERGQAVDAIVATLCSLDTVEQVQLLVEGESPGQFGGRDLSQPVRPSAWAEE